MKIILFVLLLCSSVSYGLDQSEFKDSTFEQAVMKHGIGNDAQPNSFAESQSNPAFKVAVVYTGKARGLSPGIKFFMQVPSLTIQSKKDFFSNYTKEIQVNEKGTLYWIPVQKKIFPLISEEVKVGQKFIIFIRYYGTLVGKTTKDIRPVFLMMDFAKP